MLKDIPLISLNDLGNKPHNAFFKIFASRVREKHLSFDSLMNNGIVASSSEIQWLVEGLATYWFYQKGDNMKDELTPEKVRELGRRFHDVLISTISFEDFVEKFGKEKILANLKPDEILEKIGKENILANFKPDEILEAYGKDRLMAGFTVDELELYLRKLKNKKK